MKTIELKPIQESLKDYDDLEKRIEKFFRESIYIPILKQLQLPKKTIKNTAHANALMDALFTGQIIYSTGTFSGKFNASISRELRNIGAKFDRKTSSYKLEESKIPIEFRNVISASKVHFQKRMEELDETLAKLIPEELAKQFKCQDLFDKALWKADREFKKNVKNIAVTPSVSKEQREKISKAWQDNLQLYIKGWTEKQIKDIRKQIYEDVSGGTRRKSLIPAIYKVTKTIQKSHEEALNKAKFLAHQESRLMMAAFKQTRYEEAGSKSYIWRCVKRPHDESPKQHTPGNVRYTHGKLDQKEIKWSEPPITSNPGESVRRNHAGQDYNCRCFSRPIIKVSSEK